MHFQFVYTEVIRIGGAKTLMARMAEWLMSHGHSVDILILRDESLASTAVLSLFPTSCNIYYIKNSYRQHLLYPHNLKTWLAKETLRPDVCIPFSAEALHVALSAVRGYRRPPVVIPYVINPVEYVRRNPSPLAPYCKKVFNDCIPDNCKIFMSEDIRSLHQKDAGRIFHGSLVLPLPVTLRTRRSHDKHASRRIVSIGRIDSNMKTYNEQLVPMIARLRAEGITLEWDIYGGGPEYAVENMKKLIALHQLQDFVRLNGEIAYDAFDHVLDDCFVFVGMGTSAIEASMVGAPSIVAIASSDEPMSYGLLADHPFGACGEVLDHRQGLGIEVLLRTMLALPESEYVATCNQGRIYAEQYSSERIMPAFMEHVSGCMQTRCKLKPFPYRYSLALNMKRLRRRFLPAANPNGIKPSCDHKPI